MCNLVDLYKEELKRANRKRAKKYYDAHKHEITLCPCGGKFKYPLRFNHYKTIKHRKYIERLAEENDAGLENKSI